MKKLFLLCVAVFVFKSTAPAQARAMFYGTDTIGPINDTLRYFEYKQLYKSPPTTSLTVHPYYKFHAPVAGNNAVTYVGSIFKNKDVTLQVYGLETRLYRTPVVSSNANNGGVPVRLYLCNIVNGIPLLPAIDSIYGGINDSGLDYDLSSPTNSVYPYYRIGKYFGGTFTNGPKSMTGDFAVLGKCASTLIGDTVNFLHTSGLTTTATSGSSLQKFGEGLGLIRRGGIFYKTTDFNDPSFGTGTDFEFCFAPMVTFTLQASQVESPTMQGACHCEVFTNTNTSSPEFVNRQFNFNEFYRELKPFAPAAAITSPNFIPDSVLAWDVGNGAPPFYQSVGIDSAHMSYSTGACNLFFDGNLKAKYKQSAYNVTAPTLTAILTFTGSCVWCGSSYDTIAFTPCNVGLKQQGTLSRLNIYPNPTFDKTVITGLVGTNSICLYNMTGQMVSDQTTKAETTTIDFSKQVQGAYLMRITNTANNTRIVKVIRQ